jgi:hypothetical protein
MIKSSMSNLPVVMQTSQLSKAALVEKFELSYSADSYSSHIDDVILVAIFTLVGETDFQYALVHRQKDTLFQIYTDVLAELSGEMIAYFLTLVKESQELQDWLDSQSEEIHRQQLMIGLNALLAQVR